MRFSWFAAAVLASSSLLDACGDGHELTRPSAEPTSLPSSPRPAPSQSANWTGDATVLSVTGSGGCGWGITVGDTRTRVDWRLTITGASILLEEDMSNWPTDHVPYSGMLTGRQFSAAYSNGINYLQYVCQFKGGELSGTFSDDFSSFEALETLVWGPPGQETRVRRRWIASRL